MERGGRRVVDPIFYCLLSAVSRSVVAPEHVKGFIYVEAFKQSHVKEVIKGISALRIGQYNQQMVPIKEMTDVLR